MCTQMILRDDVLKIRFKLKERKVNFLRDFLGAFKDFLLNERNIFLAVAIID